MWFLLVLDSTLQSIVFNKKMKKVMPIQL